MTDKDSDVLRDRFRSRTPDEDESEDPDQSREVENSSPTDMKIDTENERPDRSGEKESSSEEGQDEPVSEDPVRERQQEVMYLRPAERDRLRSLYDELDGRSKVVGEGGMAKNDEFYSSLVDFVTDEYRDEFVAFLGLDDI